MKKTIGELRPVGHRILVKIIEKSETSGGLELPAGIEPAFLTWAEVVALPQHKLNPFINSIKVGDLVGFMFFAKDRIVNPDTDQELIALEVERDSGVKGQIVVVYKKGGKNA